MAYRVEKHEVDPNFRSPKETCTHDESIVKGNMQICGEQIDSVCVRCGLAVTP